MLGMSQQTAGKVLKGLYAALIAGLGSLSTTLVGTAGIENVTTGQWVSILLFSLTAFGGVFGLAGWAGPSNGNHAPPKA